VSLLPNLPTTPCSIKTEGMRSSEIFLRNAAVAYVLTGWRGDVMTSHQPTKFSIWCIPAILVLGPLGTACSGTDSGTEEENERTQPAATMLTAIAEVALSDTYRVSFYEPQPGMLLVSEIGSIGRDPDSKVLNFTSASQLYRDLVRDGADSEVVEVLRAADERAVAFNAQKPTSDPGTDTAPPLDEGRSVEKHSSFLDGNQCKTTSFEGGYCVTAKWNQITSSDTGWQYCTAHFRSTVFNHQYTQSTSSARHKVFYFGTKGDFWDEVAATDVPRNTWQSWHSTWRYVKATTGRNTGQVTPGDHDQCVMDRPLNSPGLFGGCSTVVIGCDSL
jgi:hypothetical protein